MTKSELDEVVKLMAALKERVNVLEKEVEYQKRLVDGLIEINKQINRNIDNLTIISTV